MKPVFIHISKNAGTSLIASAGDQITVAGHQPARRWVQRHGRAAPLFAVVRDPYDRVVSEYSYRRRRLESGDPNAHLVDLDQPIDSWVRATFAEGVFRTQEFFDRSGVFYNEVNMVDGSLIWFVSQRRWLCDDGGELLVDQVLRFETLASDWAAYSSSLGIDAPLAHLNASPPPPDVIERFDRATRDIVFEHYRDDFDLFGYERR